MLKNYLTIAFRNFKKSKGYSIINILGLATGMACFLLILLWILNEFSYDDFHKKGDTLFRVSVLHKKMGKIEYDSPQFVPPLGPAMKRDLPEVTNYARLSTRRVAYLSTGGRSLKVDDICYADSSFFNLFSFRLIHGVPGAALTDPFSIVLTRETSRLIFNSEESLGKIIRINSDDYTVSGIAENPPTNSSITFKALISFSSLYEDAKNYMDWNGGNQYYTFVELFEKARPEAVNAKFRDFMWRYLDKDMADIGIVHEPHLQPLRDLHLFHNEYAQSRLTNIYIFSAIALLILIIACINFINLTTARANRRAREVGVRKVVGADRRSLIQQFLSESILVVLVGCLVSLILVKFLLPQFEFLVNTELNINAIFRLPVLVGMVAGVVIVGILAGSYPAFILSAHRAIHTLKSAAWRSAGPLNVRNALVVFQFVVSVALITSTIFINQQIRYMKNKALGFNKDNILVLPLNEKSLQHRVDILKHQLQMLPGVISVAALSQPPHRGLTRNGYFPEGSTTVEMFNVLDGDADFLRTFEIELASGRNFSDEIATDKNAYLINETLARTLHWGNPLGKLIRRDGEHPIIGVVKDFHFATLHQRIEPTIITNAPWQDLYDNLCIKIDSNHPAETRRAIENVWTEVSAGVPFDYYFLDESFDALYKNEQRTQEIVFYFSCIAIIIGLLGLFSLSSFTVEMRLKEVGIRKVLGATAFQVVYLLTREIIALVFISALIAAPIVAYAINTWLQHYAFRIPISPIVFIASTLTMLAIAFLTVSYQTLRAAHTNPAHVLKYE